MVMYLSVFQIIHSGKRSLAAVMIVITAIIGIFMPSLFAFEPRMPCVINKKYSFSYVYVSYVHSSLFLIMVTVVPDIVFFVANIAILLRVRRLRNDVTSAGSQRSENKSQDRVTHTAVTLSLTHLVLTLPQIVRVVMKKWHLLEKFSDTMDTIVKILLLSNYGINILIYMTTSQVFLKELCNIFSFKTFQKPERANTNNQSVTQLTSIKSS